MSFIAYARTSSLDLEMCEMEARGSQAELVALQAKIKVILPRQYHECYDDVLPVSMGSASLKYGPDGKVAWDEIWTTFCDLSLAGGPPHRGTLLTPASLPAIESNPGKYGNVVAEIARGIFMVTNLNVQLYPEPGWIGVRCRDVGMAGWMVRAIVAENVMARQVGEMVYLPAGPDFSVAKEIKNAITVTAKTCHYWVDHTPPEQQASIAKLFAESPPLLEPSMTPTAADALVRELQNNGLPFEAGGCLGWVGTSMPDEGAAIWIMRALIAENCLARREGSTLFVPAVTCISERRRLATVLGRIVTLWRTHKMVQRQSFNNEPIK